MPGTPHAFASHLEQAGNEISKPKIENAERPDAPSTDKLWGDLKNLLDEKRSPAKVENPDGVDDNAPLRKTETELPDFEKEFDIGELIKAAVEACQDGESDNNDTTELQSPERTKENGEYYSDYKDRIAQTPREVSERGEWTGERGESKYIPSDPEIRAILEQFGIDGIEYKHGIPDFSKCSACTVEIENMTAQRAGPGGNFEQCDAKCAEQWNKEAKDGKTDWTPRDVADWRRANGYSWHERNDMKTCDLVPTAINDYFGHLGGVAECKKRDAENDGGDFDD